MLWLLFIILLYYFFSAAHNSSNLLTLFNGHLPDYAASQSNFQSAATY